jgi:hypothetical protein
MCIATQRNNRVSNVAASFAPPALVVKPTTTTIKSSPSLKRKLIVQHNYHDHAADPAPQHFQQGPITTFPLKLYEMLERVEQDGFSHVVSWQPHGRCFVVHNPEEFKALLPRYFGSSKIASFQRQLNLYGFSRLTQGLDKRGYYNELFLRGKTCLVHKILRTKVKGTGVRARSNPEQEPNFWNMPYVGSNTVTPQQSTLAPTPVINNVLFTDVDEPLPLSANSTDFASLQSWSNLIQFLDTYKTLDAQTAQVVSSSHPCVDASMEEFLEHLDVDDVLGDLGEADDDGLFADLLIKATGE